MCLNRLEKFKPTRKGIGYKWVIEYEGQYYSPDTSFYKYSKNRWMRAKKQPDLITNGLNVGFHIFDKLKDARVSHWGNVSGQIFKKYHPELFKDKQISSVKGRMVIVKVEYKDYVTGYGDGLSFYNTRIILAQKMKIIKKVK